MSKRSVKGLFFKRFLGINQFFLLIFTVVVLTVSTTFVASALKVSAFSNNDIKVTESADYVDGRVLIKYHKKGLKWFAKDLTLSADMFSEFSESGIRIDHNTFFSNDEYIWYEARIKDDISVKEALNSLKKEENIVAVEPVYIRTSGEYEIEWYNDPFSFEQSYLDEVNIPAARRFLAKNGINPGGSSDVTVAVIDTGVDYKHPDLVDSMWVNKGEIPDNGIDDDQNGYVDDYYGYSTYQNNGNPMDINGHGTHVAGIIAASSNNKVGIQGIAYNTKIMALQASSSSGVFTTTAVVDAIKYAVLNGADIINMSFAGTQYSLQEEDALQAAYNSCVCIAAAGNNGKPNNPIGPNFYPASYESVIGVMASNGNYMASFSNYDYIEFDNYEYEICAPGVNIMSTLPNGQYRKWSGTSMAAPVVSGIAALLRSYFNNKEYYNTRFITDQINQTGNPTVSPAGLMTAHDVFYKVDAYNALTIAPTPSIVVKEYYIFDSPEINPLNDGDGVLDAGETAYVAVGLMNRWGKANNVTVTLDTLSDAGVADPFLTIVKGELDFGQIGAGNTQSNGIMYSEEGIITGVSDPFIVHLAENTPNDSTINFTFRVSCTNGYDETDLNIYRYKLVVPISTRNGTEIHGTIKEDTVLTNDKLWIVDNSLTIKEGVTLTIEEGTTVQFWTSSGSDPYADQIISKITVRGNLVANGTKENPINFVTSDLYQNFAIEIIGENNGIIDMTNVNVQNPRIQNARYLDSCYFIQNGDTIYIKYLSEGQVCSTMERPMVSAYDIKNSVFYGLGDNPHYDWLQLELRGNLYNNLFSCCKTYVYANGYQGYQYVVEGNVFNNSSRSNGTTLVTKIYVGYENPNFSIVDGVKNENTETGYLLVYASNYQIAQRFAKYVGGYVASINNAKEQEFLENYNFSSNKYYIGLVHDSITAKDIWEDGTYPTYNNINNPEFIGQYTIMEGSTWKKVANNNECNYFLIEIPSGSLIDDFEFASNELYVSIDEDNYKVSLFVTPSTGDLSTLEYSSSNEDIFTVNENGYITPISKGDATLTVKTNDNFVIHQIPVHITDAVMMNDIKVTDTDLELEVGEETKIKAQALPLNSTEKLIYSSNNDVISVDEFGNIYALKEGKTIVTISNGDGTVKKEINVNAYVAVSELVYSSSLLEVVYSTEKSLFPLPVYGPTDATEPVFEFESSNSAVAYVDSEGKLITSSIGLCIIRVSVKGQDIFTDLLVNVVEEVSEKATFIDITQAYLSNNGNWSNYYIGLASDGHVWMWGNGIKIPQKMDVENVKAISSSRDYSNSLMVLFNNGTIATYNGSGFNRNYNLTDVIKISSGGGNYAAVTSDGTIYAWGDNYCGQCCTGDNNRVESPTQVNILSGIKDIKINYYYLMVLTESGTLYYAGSENKTQSLTIYTGIEKINSIEADVHYMAAYGNNYTYMIYYSWHNTYETPATAQKSERKISITFNNMSFAYIDNAGKVYAGNGYNRYGKFNSANINQYDYNYYELNVSNASKIYNFENNIFIIDKDGNIYGTGLNTGYELADLSQTNKTIPTLLLFGLSGITNNRLSIISSNASGVLDIKKGFTFEFVFNDAIQAGSTLNNIRLTTNDGEIISCNKEVSLNKLFITITSEVSEDITTINVSIPRNAVTGKTTSVMDVQSIAVEVLKPINIEDIELEATELTLSKNSTHNLNVNVTVDGTLHKNDSNYKRYLTFTSSNNSVASVDRYGNVLAIAPGNATIYAKTYDESIVEEINITVKVALESINLKDRIIVLKEGETYQLNTTITPFDATDLEFTYTSNEETVATVDQNGLIEALTTGIAIINVNCNDKVASVMISVVASTYKEDKVVKFGGYENLYALTEDGDVYRWGGEYKNPEIVYTNVKDIHFGYYWNEIILQYDTYIQRVNGTTRLSISSVKKVASYSGNVIVLQENGKAFVGNFNEDELSQIGNFDNVKDICVLSQSNDYIGFVLLTDGTLYRVKKDGTYTEIEGMTFKSFAPNNMWDSVRLIAEDNTIYNGYMFNTDFNITGPNYYQYTYYMNSEFISVYDNDYYAYINNTKLYFYSGAIGSSWKTYEYDINGLDVKDIYCLYGNVYVLTTDGQLYGAGLATNNRLTSIYTTTQKNLIRLYLDNSISEPLLAFVSTNQAYIRKYEAGTEIKYTFNQNVYAENTSRINIKDGEGNLVDISVRVEGKDIIITLLEDLAVNSRYYLTIRSGVVSTFLGQKNTEAVNDFYYLEQLEFSKLEIEDFGSLYKGQNKQIKYSLYVEDEKYTNTDMLPYYVAFESSDSDIARVDRYGNVSAIAPGNATIYVKTYDEKITKEVNITVKVALESISLSDRIVVLKEGETYQLNATITPSDATDLVFTYTSNEETVATVNQNGLIEALTTGIAIINVNCNDKVASVMISVVASNYEEDKVVKIVGDSNVYALTENGDVYRWGGDYKNPTKIASSVKNIYNNPNSSSSVVLQYETYIEKIGWSTKISISNVKTLSSYSENVIVLQENGKAYFGNFNNDDLEQIGTFDNVKDVYATGVKDNYIGFILLEDGTLYRIKNDGTYTEIEGKTFKSFIPSEQWDNIYLIGEDDKYYNIYVYTNELTVSGPIYPVFGEHFNNEFVYIYCYNYYAYINNSKLYFYTSNIGSTWRYNEYNLKGLDVASIYCNYNNAFVITTDGRLYGAGVGSSNYLTSIYTTTQKELVRLYLDDSIGEPGLEYVSNNQSSIRNYEAGTEIRYTFNQNIYAENTSRVNLKNFEGDSVDISVRIAGKDVVITLLEDLAVNSRYYLTIRSGVASTFLGQKNNEITFDFYYLEPIDITDISLEHTSMALEVGSQKLINVNITPSNATNQYLTFMSNNTKVATVDNNGLVRAVGLGTSKISIKYDNLVQVLDVDVYENIETLEFKEGILSGNAGDLLEVECIYTNETANHYSFVLSSSDEDIFTIEEGKVRLVSEGLALVYVTDEYTGIRAEAFVMVKSAGAQDKKVINIARVNYTYVAVMEDGSVWAWGRNINNPINITSQLKYQDDIIGVSGSWYNLFVTRENKNVDVYYFSDDSGNISISYTKTLNDAKVLTYMGWSEWAYIKDGYLYNGNNGTKINNISNIVDGAKCDGWYYVITSNGYLYALNNSGEKNLIKDISNPKAFINSSQNSGVHVITEDGVIYYLSGGSNNGAVSSDGNLRLNDGTNVTYKALDIYDSLYFYSGYDYVILDNGKALALYRGYTKEASALTNIKEVVYIESNRFYITEDGKLYAAGSNNYNVFTVFNKDTVDLKLYRIFFGLDSANISVANHNIKGIKEYHKDDELVIEFNQTIIDNNLNSIELTDVNGNNIIIDARIEKKNLIIKLAQDLVNGNTYYLNIPEGSLESILGEVNEELNYVLDCDEEINNLGFVINNKFTEINENEYSVNLAVGTRVNLDLTLTQDASNKYLVFSSSNSSVATITNEGGIRVLGVGDTDITISNIDSSVVKVVHIHATKQITSLSLDKVVYSVDYNETTFQLDLTISPDDYNDFDIHYISSDETVATVDNNGLVTFLSEGIVGIEICDNVSGLYKDIIIHITNVNKEDTKVKQIANNGNCTHYLMTNGDVWYKTSSMIKPAKTNVSGIIDISNYNESSIILDENHKAYKSGSPNLTYMNEVSGLNNIVKVKAGNNNTYYALDNNGVLWGFGNTYYGQLGYYSDMDANEPVIVFSSNTEKVVEWTAINMGLCLLTNQNNLYYYDPQTGTLEKYDNEVIDLIDSSGNNVYFVDVDNELYSVYFNGNKTTINYYSSSSNSLISNANNVIGYDAYFIYENNGKVYTTNVGSYYYPGSNDKAIPIELKENETIVKLYGDWNNAYVITSLGRLLACGNNNNYQLVNFTKINSSEFVEISFAYNDEETLTYSSSLQTVTENINVDSEFIVEFNQPILASQIRNIRLTCGGSLVVVDAFIKSNQLHIKPMNNLVANSECVLTIPYNAIRTPMEQVNEAMTFTFTTGEGTSTSSVNNDIRIDYSADGLYALSNQFEEDGYVSNFINNSILNDYSNGTDMSKMIRIYTNEGDKTINIKHNYFGTTNAEMIKKIIVDQDTYSDYNDLVFEPFLVGVPESRYPYLTGAKLYDENGNATEFASAGINYIELAFNTDMDVNQKLNAYFGPDYPYTDFLIDGEWTSSRTWYGKFTVYQTTGDGLEHILVMGAKSALQYEMTKDFRYVFMISSIGAESLELFAEGKRDGVNLTWMGNDDELAVGYNIYRSRYQDGNYELVNTTGVISIDEYQYLDTNVQSNTTYYYKISIVYSDLTESQSDSYIDVKTPDITLPTLNHSPKYSVVNGNNLILNANCYDNNGISSVKIYYRTSGTDTFKSVAMVSYSNNNQYSGYIPASDITLAGIEYYIECMDIEGNVVRYPNNSTVNVSVIKTSVDTAPLVTYISKTTGHVSGGDRIAINGENFTLATKVYFAGIEVQKEYVNSSMLYIITPTVEEAGAVSIIVENTDGTTDIKNGIFTYFKDASEDPLVDDSETKLYYLSSNVGYTTGGNVIILYGNNFAETTKVYFGSVQAETIYVSELIMYAYVPQASKVGKVNVSVENNGIRSVKYDAYTYIQVEFDNTLQALGLSRNSGSAAGGNSISIYGSNFDNTMKVYFGTAEVTYTLVSDTIAIVNVVAGSGTVNVRIVKGTEEVVLENAYTYVSVEFDNTLQVLGLSRNSGSAAGGNNISIYGSNFDNTIKVYFGTIEATYTLVNDTLVVANVPAGSGIVNVRITKAAEEVMLENAYTYVSVELDNTLQVLGLSRNSGSAAGGNSISIYGSNFDNTIKVYFGTIEATYTLVSDTLIVVNVPAGSGVVDLTVIRNNEIALLEKAYTYVSVELDTSLQIIGLSATGGAEAGGNSISIYGSNFDNTMKVYFGTTEVEYVFINSTQISVVVPSGIGAKDVDVKLTRATEEAVLTNAYHYVDSKEYDIKLNPGVDTIYVGSTWIDAGVDTEINVKVKGSVNTYVEGRYTVEYYCYDNGVLVRIITRIVNVIKSEFKINITLNDSVTTLKVNEEYVENGASSNAGVVRVYASNVDTTKAGTYTVTYVVTYNGVSYYKTRYIHVIENA